MPYARNEKLARSWAFPGVDGLQHRIGGLEKDALKGNISTVPENHQIMVDTRAAKVAKVADSIPAQGITLGEESGDLLVVGWGGTKGNLVNCVEAMIAQGNSISLCHLNYINPLPHGVEEIFSRFKRIVVCELNMGQAAGYLRQTFPHIEFAQYNKCEGLPFTINELSAEFSKLLNI